MRPNLLILFATVTATGCPGSDPAYHSDYDEATGALDNFDDCTCTAYTSDRDLSFSCGNDFVMFPPIPAELDVFTPAQFDMFYGDLFGRAMGVLAVSAPYPDPRREDGAFMYRSVHFRTLVVPAQLACDPIRINTCGDVPAGSVTELTFYCTELGI